MKHWVLGLGVGKYESFSVEKILNACERAGCQDSSFKAGGGVVLIA